MPQLSLSRSTHMQIISDIQAVVSSLTSIIVNTTTKVDQITSNVLDVGVSATGEWKEDAEFEAKQARAARSDKYAEYEAKKAAKAKK